MNILIPHTWLQKHLDTEATPDEIREKVSLSGPSIETVTERDGDVVYDIEVTTNRVDSMSVRGIAREVAVILHQFGIGAQLKELELPAISSPGENQLPLPTITNDPALCNRIMCVILDNVSRAETPDWMATHLQQVEMNVHDAAIDITNYITHELGHPCHAFDYDKIMQLGGEIIVKEADAGKSFTTLDGESYETVGGEVVFENAAGEIIDLPAIKGTANTAVDEQTTRILLWIESLQAEKVRFGSMTHAIRTVAAQLNEKHVDPELAEPVLQYGVKLYQELCGATVASTVYDEYPHPRVLEPVEVQQQRFVDYLGIALETHQITDILEQLGCEVRVGGETLTVIPPSFRPDITIPADVIEEVARIYGYHRLPSVLMDTAIPVSKPTDTDFHFEYQIKQLLAARGWQEVYTYSMVSEAIATASGMKPEEHLQLQNPLTEDRVYLRRSLLPSLQEFIDANPQRDGLAIFEIAMTYTPQDGELADQELRLSLVADREYRWVRGQVEALLAAFFIPSDTVRIQPHGTAEAGWHQSGELTVTEDALPIGTIGQLPSGDIGVDISMTNLLHARRKYPSYQPAPKAAPVIEDMTVTLPEDTRVGEVVATIRNYHQLIHQVALKDVYQQNYTFTITYLDPDQSLSTETVAPIRQSLAATLAEKHQAQLVGAA